VRLLGVVVALAGALVVGALVLGDVALSGLGLWDGAGWIGLVALAFPAFVAWGAWKHGD